METKHTPGPWAVEGEDDVVTPYVDDRIAVRTGGRSRAADAHLIAAAPDLLAACKGALDQPETPEAYDAMIRRIQSALAKAEGRG